MIDTHQQLSEEQFEKISQIVYRHCGINLHDGKRELVQARLAKRMRVKAIANTSDYLRYALDDSQEFTHLIDALSTNLTSFFRENAHFEHLETEFLPALLERKQKARQLSIRAWSAGCSTGEEPYSIAMTLLHAAGGVPANGAWDIKLLATDLSTDVLAQARQGTFDVTRTESIRHGFRSRFLVRDEKSPRRVVHVAQEVRDIVRFGQLNLMNTWPFTGPFDFIFCRNVMIYFDKPTQQTLVNRFWDVLDRRGLLFTGHSESLTGVTHRFGYVRPTIYVKN